MLSAHIEVLSLTSLVDSVDLLVKHFVKRLLRVLCIALAFFPFVFALILVLYFDLWLIVTGVYLTL